MTRSTTLALLSVPACAVLLGAAIELDGRRDAAAMARAASGFLSSLDAEQRDRAAFALDSEERLRWHFIPNEMHERRGVMLKEMSGAQRERAHDLLRAGLSGRGYLTATQVMALEDVLLAREGGARMARDRDEYFFTVFGTPAAGGTWAWRFEGHHISLHFTVSEGDVTVSAPTFVGANPAEVRDGPMQGTRVLGAEEDRARALVRSLRPDQRVRAIVAEEAPRDILTGTTLEIDPLEPAGIPAHDLSAEQRRMLGALIEAYTSLMADEIAAARLDRVRAAGFENVAFAWAGGTEPGERHYYRVQGPTFLIEYDNTQNDANHIHSVWRDFEGDFGRDLLRDHVRGHPH